MLIGTSSFSGRLFSLALAITLAACATSAPEQAAQPSNAQRSYAYYPGSGGSSGSYSGLYTGSTIGDSVPPQYTGAAELLPGTGNFINRQAATQPQIAPSGDGVVTLNFEAASIRDVVKVVFDTLQENYVIDPQVDGEVTVQTSRPLPREALIPTLETLLRMNNAALIRSGGVYKIVPISGALAGNTAPRLRNARTGPGYSVRIFPLKYISATEMEKILQPFAPEGGILHVDPMRNLLMLAGTASELSTLQQTVDIFDVNWLKGMAVAMYTLQNVESQEVAAELENLFGESSQTPLAGLLRFVPVERINALMVISPQREYLTQVGSWIERLDGSGGERLYVYSVQNGDAEYISGVLNQVFEGSTAAAPVRVSGDVAPSRQPAEIGTGGIGGGGSAGSSTTRGGTQVGSEDLEANSLSAMQGLFPERVSVDTGLGSSVMGNVRIIPDTENNSLLIWATNQNYEKILNALRKVDITPRQVLVEATIAEVQLNDELEFGLQWYFENNAGAYEGVGSLNLPTNVPIETSNPADSILNNAFSYALVDSAGFIRALLRTLAQENKLRILSSPQLMVIDNQEANIRVGDQVPVQTATTVTTGGNTVESIEFKDTGVLLTVRPQVNAGGLVTMDLNQEVTDVGEIDDATGQRTFLQRTINSKVAIQTGKTIVLGGLIRENDTISRSGVPVLYKLPIVGPLFGRTNESFRRTELIVLITPRVIRDNQEAEQVTAELRDRMQSLTPITQDLFQPSELRF